MTPSWPELLRTFLRIGILSFGGPAGQIATMHRVLVEEKGWLDEPRFLHALNFCMLLPGPEAQQLVTYAGWRAAGIPGGAVAGTLFVLPGFLVMLALAAMYVGFHHVPVVQGLFLGLKPAVLAVVLDATLRIGRRTLRGRGAVMVAAAAFAAIFVLDAPFPLVVLAAGIIGGVARRAFAPARPDKVQAALPSWRRVVLVGLVCLGLWLAPMALALAAGPGGATFTAIGVFFAKLALVTFGGAYAALAYVAQQAVDVHGWLSPGEMLDGLGLAETTPGPLILVTQFVGFLAAFRAPGGLNPWLAGVMGAALTVWVTFLPSFLWIFIGAPYLEVLRANRVLAGALAAITAAVVGVILNLALWFGLHVLFARVGDGVLGLPLPELSSVRPVPGLLALAAAFALIRLRWNMIAVMAGCGLAGALTVLL